MCQSEEYKQEAGEERKTHFMTDVIALSIMG